MARLFPYWNWYTANDPTLFIDNVARELLRLRDIVQTAELELEGCGDNSCVVQTPKGMATNGGCRCDERKLRSAVRILKARAQVKP